MVRSVHVVCALVLFAPTPLPASPGEMPLPWSDDFAASQLDPGWTVDIATGNHIEVRDGALAITAPTNTYAHIERALGRDLVAVSARLRPAPAISWTSSLFLYWNPSNWCQIGVIDRDGGRFYVTLMVAGTYEEHDLAQCARQEWQRVQIELGKDCVRYLSSKDGKAWEALLVNERPTEFTGPPSLLIAGKGYSRGEPPYPAPDLDNNYSEAGGVGVSWIDDLRVEATRRERLTATPKERLVMAAGDRDACGEAELSRPGDPSFETVARYFPPMQHPREAIGVPAHPHDIGVREDGALEFTDNAGAADASVARFQVGEPPIPFAADQKRVKRRLLDGWLPAVVIKVTHEGLAYEQTVFGYSDGLRTNTKLWAYVRFEVHNPGPASRQTAVRVLWQPAGTKPGMLKQMVAPPKQSAAVCWRMPYSSGERPAVEEISEDAFDARQSEVRAFWRSWLAQGMALNVPESRVQNAWRAWLCFSSLNVDQQGERFEAHDGEGFYEAIFGYSAALYAHALDLWGRRTEAEQVLATLLSFQDKDGLYTQNYGLPDQGALLFALAEHFRLVRDETWLRRVAPGIRAAAEWIVRQRDASRRDRPDRSAVTYGLIRFRPYCDYGEPVFDYYGEAYTCRGLEEAATALEVLNDPSVPRFRSAAAEYRRDLLASMDRAVLERKGMKILPMEPDTHRLLKSTGYRGGGYYGLVASMMLESGFLTPTDKRSFLITDFMERRRGLILGLCEFGGGIDHAYTYGYLLTQLQRNEIERVLLGFYAMFAYGMSPDTYSGVECTAIKTGQNAATLPHLYSATQQLRLLRMLLLRETDDGLLLAYGLPRRWLADGQRVALRNAPTHFGPVSYEIRSKVEHREITVCVIAPKSRPNIRLRLRSPLYQPIASVTLNGRDWPRFAGDLIDLGQRTGALELKVRYRTDGLSAKSVGGLS